MLDPARQTEVDPFAGQGAGCPSGDLAAAGDKALPVERHRYDEHPEWFTKLHHELPRRHPVPNGTLLYAVTNGVMISTTALRRLRNRHL